MSQQRIVVGVDGSTGARTALLWAAAEAALRGAELLVVHGPDTREGGVVGASPDRALLGGHVALARERQPSVPVTMLASEGPAADALIEQSRRADLIVVGTRGRGGITQSMLGSVSYRVAAHADCPVAVIPEQFVDERGQAPARVVVGLSPSAAGRAALDFAFAEATHRAASVQVLHAQEPTDDGGMGQRALPNGGSWTQAVAHLDQLRASHPRLSVETVVTEDEPVDALLRLSVGAQLVALGCHHSADRWATRLGPIPAAVLHRSDCPVVVVGTSPSVPGAEAPSADG
ncbi:MAG: universal stress protein [Actinomycetia bacterium]|nr:universal stress protein [Actinomycetes bacterium]